MTPKVKNSISKSGNGYTGDTLHDGNRYMCPICSEEIYLMGDRGDEFH